MRFELMSARYLADLIGKVEHFCDDITGDDGVIIGVDFLTDADWPLRYRAVVKYTEGGR